MARETELRQRLRSSESPAGDSLLAGPDSSTNAKIVKRETKSRSSFLGCCGKSTLIVLCFVYITVPFVFYTCLWVRQHLVFLTFINIPPFLNLSNPEGFHLNCPQNMYIDSVNGIKLGSWYIQSKTIKPCSKELFAGDIPVVLYLHGNSGSRGGTHRVGLYKLLSDDSIGVHVLAFDYRGYGDSTSERPTAPGVVTDAVEVYKWLRHKHNVPASRIFIWGHSLGTGVSMYLMARLNELGERPAGLILESPFDQVHNVVKYHPLSRLHRIMPGFQEIFVDPIKSEPTTNFDSLSRIDKINPELPILILHAEDDAMVPYELGKTLFEKLKESRDKLTGAAPVSFIGFEKRYGYGHKYIFQHPDLSRILNDFFLESRKVAKTDS